MSDRAAQDQIIRFLADARAVAIAEIPEEELPKARRFSRFLIRRYYRDRLVRGFRYAQMLGCEVAPVADSAEFERVLDEAVLGSLETAERVAGVAVCHFKQNRDSSGQRARLGITQNGEHSWWEELLRYEATFFLQVATAENAGPSTARSLPFDKLRVGSRSARDDVGGGYRKGLSARVEHFAWRMPELVMRVKQGQEVGEDLRGECALLFSRTREGRVYVVEMDARTERAFQHPEQCDDTELLGQLVGIGALVRG